MYAVEADSAANTITLVKWVAGVRTEIASASFVFAPGQILWLGADFKSYNTDSGRIKVYASLTEGVLFKAANLVLSEQDTAVGPGGSAGFLSYQGNCRFVDFTAGSPEHAQSADWARFAEVAATAITMSGTEPTSYWPGMIWLDITVGTVVLNIRNEDNDGWYQYPLPT
jgi:hypothetical protein